MLDWKREIRSRLSHLELEATRETEIVEELAQHLEDCYAELLASGASPAEAERRTRAELIESKLLARELRCVEHQVTPEPIVLGTNRKSNMIADLWQDLRYGARILLKTPLYRRGVITLRWAIVRTLHFQRRHCGGVRVLPYRDAVA